MKTLVLCALACGAAACPRGLSTRFVGNSVSRGWAFALSALNSGESYVLSRQEQMARCGKEEGQTCELPGNVSFVWSWGVASPLTMEAMRNPHADVVMVNVGSHYIFTQDANWEHRTIKEAGKLARAATRSPARVWLRTSTRVCGDVYGQSSDRINDQLHVSNNILTQVFEKAGVKVFDAWTPNASCAIYDDAVHSRRLAEAQLKSWLACAPSPPRAWLQPRARAVKHSVLL